MTTSTPILEVEDLAVEFATTDGRISAVNGVSLEVAEGEVLAVVGESGSGKSVTALTILQLLPDTADIARGSVRFQGTDLLSLSERQLRSIRGRDIAMIFQEPISSLNPLIRVGKQLEEAIRAHTQTSRASAAARAIELLEMVQVPAARRRVSEYPHQFSGGMAQRVAIAMALANQPKLLIADEPTTALDVTVQAQVLETLRQAQQEARAAMILITHDMGLVAETADQVAVMYAGRIVESGGVHEVISTPKHPYTRGLLASLPRIEGQSKRLIAIPGQPNDPGSVGMGCAFVGRCASSEGRDVCRETRPQLELQPNGSLTACHFSAELVT